MKPLVMPSLEVLNQIFYLDEESPSGLRWKRSSCTRIKPGAVAGTKSDKGYWNVYITDRRYKVHRIIFYMRTGIDPGNNLVDHVNRVSSDNTDLRVATRSQNAANCTKGTYKKSPTHSRFKGVTWHKGHKKWLAQISVNKKKSHLGYFDTELEAAAAYNAAASDAWGKFSLINDLTPE
jgi:hypothetical protein